MLYCSISTSAIGNMAMENNILKALYDWNPWLEGKFPHELRGLDRDCNILEYLKLREIKILSGARRVGKSTLLYQAIEHLVTQGAHVLYVNFDDEELKNYSLKEIVHAYLTKGEIDCLFIDEIQHCSEWVHFIRNSYDRKEIEQIWVSGSNSSLIKKEFKTLLTGRNISIHIHPLSFHEYLRFKECGKVQIPTSSKNEIKIKKYFLEYLNLGSFPAIAQSPIYHKELLTNYFEDFLYKDIAARYEVNTTKLRELGLYLATNSGKPFSYRGIATALGIHPNTMINYLSYCTEIFLFSELYRFDYSLKAQIGHEKKIYCVDTGLAAAVSFRFSDDQGRMLENLVYNELRRRRQEIYFHKKTKECDFIVKHNLSISQAIQVCLSLSNHETKQRELNGLVEAMSLYKLKKGLILTLNEEGHESLVVDGNRYEIQILPVWKWMLQDKRNDP